MSDDDKMPDLPEMPELEGLLSAYRSETARSSAQVDAALESVTAHVGTAGTGAATATGLSTTAKVGLLATVVGVAGAIGLAISEPATAPERPSTPVVIATPVREPVVPPEVKELPSVETTPQAETAIVPPASPATAPQIRQHKRRATKRDSPIRPAPAKASPAKTAPANTLAEELKRLQQARAALRAGNPARARALVKSHRRDFPTSTVARERDATEIAALCAESRDTDAKRKAVAFGKAYPGADQDLLADCDG